MALPDTEISTAGTNLGIGTTSQANALNVKSTLTVGDNTYTSTAAPANGALIKGNVGIGSLAPGANLDVTGTIRSSGTITGSNLSGTNTGDQTCSTVSGCVVGAITSVVADSPLSGSGTSGSHLIFTNPGYISSVVADSPLSGSGTSGSHLIFTNPGYITGNQTITLTGPVTGSGATSIATTIGALQVQSSNINWSNVNGLNPVNSGGINWSNVNGLAQINTGGINWTNFPASGFAKWNGQNPPTADLSTYLTGNQTITLSGDVSGSGATAIATAIGALKVQSSMINWSNINGLTPINTGGINWNNVNGTVAINNGAVNWANINGLLPANTGLAPINTTGINWTNFPASGFMKFAGQNPPTADSSTYQTTSLTTDSTWVGNAGTATATAIGSCSAGTSALTYNTTSHAFGCNSISSSSPGGSSPQVQYNNLGALGGINNLTTNGTNVGMGTSSYPNILQIAGNVGIATLANSAMMTTNLGSKVALAIDGNVGIGTYVPQNALIVASGNVGINTAGAAPNPLYVGGTAGVQGFQLYNAPVSGGLLVSNSTGIGTWMAATTLPYSTSVGANPSATVSTSATNGSSANFMRADAAPAIDLTMAPTWTGTHTFNSTSTAFNTGTGNVGIGTTKSIGVGVMSMNVGIGTWVPGQMLDVKGTANVLGFNLNGIAYPTASTADNALVADGTNVVQKSIGSCSAGSSALTYNTSTHAFGCNSISGGTPGGSSPQIQYNNGGSFAGITNLTSNGTNVGIGTSGYQDILQVAGGVGISTAISSPVLTTALGSKVALAIQGNVGIGTYVPQNALIVASGNVGINTAGAAPNALYVGGTAELQGFQLDNQPVSAGVLVSNSVGVGTWMAATTLPSGGGTTNPGGTSPQIQYNNGGAFGGITNLTSNGTNVGIGTSSYQNSLAIVGNVGISTVSYSPALTGSFPTPLALVVDGNVGIGTWSSIDDRMVVKASTSGNMFEVYDNSNNSKLLITSGGNTGVGTSNPLNTLAVGGSAAIGLAYATVGIAPANSLSVQGNIGIGTNQPDSFLSVGGKGNPGGVSIGTSGDASAQATSSVPLKVFASSATNPAWINGFSTNTTDTDIVGPIISNSSSTNGRISGIWMDDGWNGNHRGSIATVMLSTAGNSNMYFSTYSGSAMTRAMTINENQNVGIGSANPNGYKLEVNGTVKMTGLLLNQAPLAAGNVLVSNSVGVGTWMADSTLPAANLVSGNIPNLAYYSGASTISPITGGGSNGTNIGINTTSFTNTLNVYGGVGISTWNNTNYLTTSMPTSSGTALIVEGNVGIGTWTPQGAFSVGVGTYTTGKNFIQLIDKNGNIGIGTNQTNTQFLSMGWGGNVGIGTYSSDQFFQVGKGNSSFHVGADGNVSIGTKTASANLITIGSTGQMTIDNTGAETTSAVITSSASSGFANSSSTAAFSGTSATAGSTTTYQGGTSTTSGVVISSTSSGTGTTDSIKFNLRNTQAAVMLDNSGTFNIGIGTSKPAETLAIIGNVGIGTTISNQKLDLFAPASPGGQMYVQGNVGIGTYISQASNQLGVAGTVGIGTLYSTFAGSSNGFSNGLIVQGNVGVGTTAPGVTLDIVGRVRSVGIGTTVPVQVCLKADGTIGYFNTPTWAGTCN